jgi:hypothetical protein
MLVGWTVLVSSTTLLVTRRWRADRSWIDRSGRVAGAFWISTSFVVMILFIYIPGLVCWSIVDRPFYP